MIVANMFVTNKFVICSGLAYSVRMARDDESRKARLAAAAEARAAQAEMRQTVQAAMREARQNAEAAKAEARAQQESVRKEIHAAMADARGAYGRGGRQPRGFDQEGIERRGRRGKEPLSRDLIVDEAMRQMASKGLESLTMRSIAWALDTGPASLYVHVRNTAELHGLLLDAILGGIDLEGEGETWRERIASILKQYFALLMANPEFARSALTVKPSGHHTLALLERLLALLAEGGVPPKQAAWGVDLLLLWATAGAAEHAPGAAEQPDNAQWDVLRLAMTTPDAYPQISTIGLDLVSGTGESRSAWAIEALLNGIAGTARA